MTELAEAVDDVLLGLGDGVTRVQRKQYAAYQRLRNFACVIPPQQAKVLVYLKADPKGVDLVPGFTRDVKGLGHHGTGDLEVQLRTWRDGSAPWTCSGSATPRRSGFMAGKTAEPAIRL